MTWIVAGATVIGGGLNYLGSQNASAAQSDAANKSLQLQKDQFDRTTALQEPFRQAGISGQNRLMELMGIGGNQNSQDYGKYSKDFGMSDFTADPGYGFRVSEGLKALDRTAAARGGLISGNALRAAGTFGQKEASDEYSNAFNRYQINRNNQINPLQSLAGQGMSASGLIGNAGQSFATGAGNSLADAANARASGYVGGANAINGGLNSYLNYTQNKNLLDTLTSSNRSSSYSPYNYASSDFVGPPTAGGYY